MLALCLVLLASLCPPFDFRAMAQTEVTTTTTGEPLPPPGKVIVELRNDILTAAASDIAADADVEPIHVYDTVLNGFSAEVSAAELQDLAKNPAVASITPDYPVQAFADPVVQQIQRTGLDTYPPAGIDGVSNFVDVDIAILDTGVDKNHPDLNVVGGVSCIGNDPDAWGKGASGRGSHGTHVAGIAAALDNGINANGRAVVGAAPGARIWSYKVLDDSGNGSFATVICGLDAAAANGAIDVINMSLGNPGFPASPTCGSDTLHTAVCDAVNNFGIPVIVAAGNDGIDAATTRPAMYDEVITVGGVNDSDGLPGGLGAAPCGGWGPDDGYGGYSNFGHDVNIAAPGTCILSTYPLAHGTYASLSGTSMASPLVAGAAALYLAGNPWASPADVRAWLLSDDVSKPQNSTVGWTPAKAGGPDRMLYLGPIEPPDSTIAPGAVNPVFTGVKVPVASVTASSNQADAGLAVDGDAGTTWYSAAETPASVTLTLDLGSATDLNGIRWKFSTIGSADEFTVGLSGGSGGTVPLGTFGQQDALSQTYYGAAIAPTINARYVTFTFANPNSDLIVGAMAEVEAWTPTIPAYLTGTVNPTFPGTKKVIASSSDVPVSSRSVNAWDGNPATNWYATVGLQQTATLKFDLALDVDLSGVKWKFSNTSNAPIFDVKVTSANGQTSQTFGPFRNGASTTDWYGFATGSNVRGRYVEFTFTNASGTAVVGSIAEVEIWIQSVSLPPGSLNPGFTGQKVPVVSSTDTPASNRSPLAWDGNPGTDWYAGNNFPPEATLRLDLGRTYDLSGIKWKFASLGNASEFTVKVINEQGGARTYGPFGNGLATQQFYGFAVPDELRVRYVEFHFQNVAGVSALGSIAEVEVWAKSTALPDTVYPPGAANPSFAGSAATVITSNATMNSAATIKTRDGDPASNWTSGTLPDGTVVVTLDLGRERQVTGVKWMTAFNGFADKFTVRLMNEAYGSATLGTFGNPGASRTWYGVATAPKTARWVKFYIENPNSDYVVGSLGEIQVFASDTANNPPPPGTPRPGFAGSKLPVSNVTATMNSWAAPLMIDGSPT